MEYIELNWLRKHMKQIRSSQPAIHVLNWMEHQSFPVGIVKTIKASMIKQGNNKIINK